MVAAAIVTSISISGGAYAATNDAIIGMVSAINSTDIILLGKDNTTYTINTKDAKIVNADSLSDIHNGDMLIVQGSIDGTSLKDATILDGSFIVEPSDAEEHIILTGKFVSSQAAKGEGIEGIVTALNDNTLTIKDNDASYQIDARNSKVLKDFASVVSSLSEIKIGDKVIIR